jgi:large subunit ribosomal protein L10
MSKEKKGQIIDELEEEFSSSTIGILTDYRGLTNSEITGLRRRIQKAGGEYKVIKNTLARFAAERAGKDDLVEYLKGPLAIAFGRGDITEPAKVLAAWINETKIELEIKGGFSEDKVLTPAEIKTLSTLPSREVLIARLLGQINSPISSLVYTLNSPIQGLVGVLNAQIQKLEGE